MNNRVAQGEPAGRHEAWELQEAFFEVIADPEADIDAVVDHLAQVAAGSIGDFGVVYIVAPDSELLQLGAVHHREAGRTEAFARAVGEESWAVGEAVLGESIETGRAVFAPDWAERQEAARLEDSYLSARGSDPVHSLLIAPMRLGRDVVGQLVCGRHPDSAPYDETELTLGASLACQAASKLEQIELNDQLRCTNRQLQEAVDLRERFIGITSHRLRTPLGTMRLLNELLIEQVDAADEAIPAEDVLTRTAGFETQVERMAETVDRLLDVSRLTDGRVTDLELVGFDFVDRLRSALDGMELEGRRIRLETAAEAIEGIWDPKRIDQIVTELVRRTGPMGGGAPVDVRVEAEEAWVRLVVETGDPGDGTSRGKTPLEHFVDQVPDSHEETNGLGLWAVHQLVEAFGGTVSLQVQPGKGGRFEVTLPRDVSPHARTEGGEYLEPPEEARPKASRSTSAEMDGAESSGTPSPPR